MEKHWKISMEQSPKFNRNWIYFKKSSKIILLHLSDLQYMEYCFNQPKGHFWLEKMHGIHTELGGNGVFTSAQPSLKLQFGIPFSMVTNRILGNSLSSFNIFRNPSTQKAVGTSSTFFYPSFPRYVESLSTLVSPSEVPSMQTWNSRTNARLFHCGDLLRLYECKVRKLHHMGGTFNFKGCPIVFETPVTDVVIPNHWSLRQKLCGAQGSTWIEEPYLQREICTTLQYTEYIHEYDKHMFPFSKIQRLFLGVEEGKVSRFHLYKKTNKKNKAGRASVEVWRQRLMPYTAAWGSLKKLKAPWTPWPARPDGRRLDLGEVTFSEGQLPTQKKMKRRGRLLTKSGLPCI